MKRKLVISLISFLMCLTIGSFGQDRRDRDRFPRRGACFFKDADFNGDFFCMRDDESLDKMPHGFNDKISSIRIFGGATVVVFGDNDFHGKKMEFHKNVRNLSRIRNTNDMISSVRIR